MFKEEKRKVWKKEGRYVRREMEETLYLFVANTVKQENKHSLWIKHIA